MGLNTVNWAAAAYRLLARKSKRASYWATMNRKLLRGLGYDDTVIVTYTNSRILKGISVPVFFREINAKRAVQTISYLS